MDSLPHPLGAISQPAQAAARENWHEAHGAAQQGEESEGHRALVAAAQRGDKEAFAALVELYQNTVYGFLRARLIEPADVEDLSQEVFPAVTWAARSSAGPPRWGPG